MVDNFKIDKKGGEEHNSLRLTLRVVSYQGGTRVGIESAEKEGNLDLAASKINVIKDIIPSLLHVLTISAAPRRVKNVFLRGELTDEKFSEYLDPEKILSSYERRRWPLGKPRMANPTQGRVSVPVTQPGAVLKQTCGDEWATLRTSSLA